MSNPETGRLRASSTPESPSLARQPETYQAMVRSVSPWDDAHGMLLQFEGMVASGAQSSSVLTVHVEIFEVILIS